MTIYGDTIIADQNLETRDAIGVSETESFSIETKQDSELLFIEVPMMTL
jgi:hypothetical protein